MSDTDVKLQYIKTSEGREDGERKGKTFLFEDEIFPHRNGQAGYVAKTFSQFFQN